MAVPDSSNRIQYTGNDATSVFSTGTIIFYETTDLVVVETVIATNVDTTYTLDTDYTVTGGNGAAGSITLLAGALPSTKRITIYRDIEYKQEVEFAEGGAVLASTLETALDKTVILTQQLKDNIDRSLKYPATDTSTSFDLPLDRASKFLAFDASGNPVASVGSTSVGTPFGTTGIDLAAADTPAEAISVLSILSDAQTFASNVTVEGTLGLKGKFQWQYDGERTLSSNTITVLGSYHAVRSQVAANPDQLDTISTSATGLFVALRMGDASEVITIRSGVGNIITRDGIDVVLDSLYKIVFLMYDSTLAKWLVVGVYNDYIDNVIATAKIYSGTAQTVSGSAVNFTSLPTGIKRLTATLSAVSTTGTAPLQLQLGDIGGLETSGYTGVSERVGVSRAATATSAFNLGSVLIATDVISGIIQLELLDAATNTWCIHAHLSEATGNTFLICSGVKSLSATLDRLSFLTADAFDGSGKINIQYEL